MNATEAISVLAMSRNMSMSVMTVTVLIGVEAVFGLLGNALIVIVFTRQYERCNFRQFVVSMATIDLISCITTLPAEMYSQLNWYSYEYNTVCKIKTYFNVFTVWGSASILCILSFDRFWKVTHPLSRLMSVSVAGKLCFMAILVSAVVSLPAAVLWGKQTYTYEHDGHFINVTTCEKDNNYSEQPYPLIYMVCVYVGSVGVMIILMTFWNILTATRLFRDGLEENDSGQMQEAHDVISTLTQRNTTLGQRRDNVTSNLGMREQPSEHRAEKSEAEENCVNGTNKTTVEVTVSCDCRPQNDNTTSPSNRRSVCIHTGHHSDCHHHALDRQKSVHCRRRKTLIMFILTSVFTLTVFLYIILSSLVASQANIIRNQSNTTMTVIFLFWRLYFINCVIDPIIYGLMDPRFRSGVRNLLGIGRRALTTARTQHAHI